MPTRRTVNPLVTKPAAKKVQATKKANPQKAQAAAKSMPVENDSNSTQRQRQNNSQPISNQKVGRFGNVGSIGDLSYSNAGKAWITFTLAYTPYDPQAKQVKETVWYDCISFGQLAEHVAECVSQGMRVIAVGRPQWNEWTDDEGIVHRKPQILCDAIGPDLTFATVEVQKVNRTTTNVSEPKFFDDEEF